MKENPLDAFLKKHTGFCSVHIYSGDRHCSCGRDLAIADLVALRERTDKAEEAIRMFFSIISAPGQLVDPNDPANADFLKAFQAMRDVFKEHKK